MDDCKQSWGKSRNQIIASLSATALHFQIGICMAFATIILPPELLIAEDNPNNITEDMSTRRFVNNQTGHELGFTKDEASWMTSLLLLTATIGAAISGPIMDRWGRKFTCILAGLFYLVGWSLTISVKTNIYILYAARSLCGLAEGLSPTGIIYATEASHKSIRTSMMASAAVFVCLGILFTSILGYIMTWQGVAIFSAITTAVNTLALFFIPETPQWLSMSTKNEEDRISKISKSLTWLYKDPGIFQEELNHYKLQGRCKDSKEIIPLTNVSVDKKSEEPESQEEKSKLMKSIILLCVLFFLQQGAGGFVVIFYALQIFQATGSMSVSGWVGVIALGVIRFLMAVCAAFQYFGRRTLLLNSSIGAAMAIISASLWLHIAGPSLGPVVLVLLYVAFSSYGVIVVPWTLLGELLPNKYRGQVSGYILCYTNILLFVTIKISILAMDAIGIANMFMFFGVMVSVMFVFVYFAIPETRGKTLDEIQRAL